jgi:type VI secretion system protein ImpG
MSEDYLRKQIAGVRSISARPIVRPLPVPGLLSFGRGLELTLSLEESAFTGVGAFLLGAVLDEFFARYMSINSFIETVIKTVERGEVIRWPMRTGRRPAI